MHELMTALVVVAAAGVCWAKIAKRRLALVTLSQFPPPARTSSFDKNTAPTCNLCLPR